MLLGENKVSALIQALIMTGVDTSLSECQINKTYISAELEYKVAKG
jgi:hypothetical protein